MRFLTRKFAAIVAVLTVMLATVPVFAQTPVVFFQNVDAVSGAAVSTGDAACIRVKYRGTTTGKPTVEAAASGDLTFKIAGSADTTTGCSAGTCPASGIFDLSTPNANIDTMGELVNLINTTGSNWVAVLDSCLASDLTDNAIITLSAVEAGNPGGASFFRDVTTVSATSTFSGQVSLLPAGTDIRFFLSGGPIGNTTGSTKVNPNPFANQQIFVQNIREKITSTGTIALFEVLGVTRSYDSSGKVSETVRSLWSETGAATTVEKAKDFNSGPIVGAKGEMIIVRQRTATDLTAVNVNGNGYMVRR